MKKTFYNPHTVITDITNLDKKWLDKQNRDKPYDQHYTYLEALRLIGKGDKKEFIAKVGNLLFNSGGSVRVSSLLERATPSDLNSSSSISTIEVKSKKVESMVRLSPLLLGLVPVEDEVDVDIKNETELSETPHTSANNISDTTQSPTSLTLDVIDISELDEKVIEKEVTESISESKTPKDLHLKESTPPPVPTLEEEEDEEVEYVSNTVVLKEESVDLNPAAKVVTTQENTKEEKELIEAQEGEPHRSYMAQREVIPSASEAVQIEHSKFTSWLKGLPRLNEMNQLPETEPKSLIISEPYAKILVAQGHKTDAIRMYEQLMLKYPEKSSFFAVQIKKLK